MKIENHYKRVNEIKNDGLRREYLRITMTLAIYKEPILDDVEKKYLSAAIKPFRKKVSYISKLEKVYPETDQFIKIMLINGEYICLPYFTRKSRMYIGMEKWRHYTLQELGL